MQDSFYGKSALCLSLSVRACTYLPPSSHSGPEMEIVTLSKNNFEVYDIVIWQVFPVSDLMRIIMIFLFKKL